MDVSVSISLCSFLISNLIPLRLFYVRPERRRGEPRQRDLFIVQWRSRIEFIDFKVNLDVIYSNSGSFSIKRLIRVNYRACLPIDGVVDVVPRT